MGSGVTAHKIALAEAAEPRRQQFKELYEGGKNIRQIAAETGLTVQRVQQILAKSGYVPRYREPKPTREELHQRWLDQKIFKFWASSKRDEITGCWNWTKAKFKAGYGRCHWKNEGYAHRVAWIITHGEIPAGLEVCHACDNPACINPDHLWLGTHLENCQDRDAKGRGKGGRPKRVAVSMLQALAAPEGGEG